jgi:tRNA threonylcarbamoyladenosine biosynthesis protein TsaB
LALILNIETATTQCSVALAKHGVVMSSKELNEGYSHAENLHVFIDEVLKQAGIEPKQLNAVAVGSGPGSYTGLRIGVSAAKGLAFSLQIPLIAVNTLKIMTASIQRDEKHLYCPMLDARRMEVYCAIYDADLSEERKTSAEIISSEDLNFFKVQKPIVFFGDGMMKCKDILSALPGSTFVYGIFPSAKILAKLSFQSYSQKQFEDVSTFEPFYLKDFLIKTKA